MTRWLRIIILSLLVGGCTYEPTGAEKDTVSELTSKMTTHGLGRYLVDLPSSWRYGSGEVTLYYGLGADFKVDRIQIINQGVTATQFKSAIDWKQRRLSSITNQMAGAPMLVGAWDIDANVDGDANRQAVLLRYYEGTTLDNYHTHEVHLLLGSIYVLLKAKSYEGVINPVEQRLQALAKQIFVISDPARAGPGFVLGPIVIRGTHDHEVSTVKFYDPDRRDLTLEINSSAVTPDGSRRLLQRSQAALPLFRRGGAKLDTLRSGRRAFAGMEGEEDVLGSDSMQDDGARVRRLLFSAETYRPDPGLSRPTLTVQLKSGGHLSWLSDAERQARRDAPDFLMTEGYLPRFAAKSRQSSAARIPPITSSLTDYEAMSAWDAILPTIRLRSGALPRPDAGDDRASPISREQAERDRRALDDFLSSWPVDNPDKSAS